MSSPHNATSIFSPDPPPPPPPHSTTNTSVTTPSPSHSSGLPIPIIAGAGGGGLVLVIIAITTWCVVSKRRRRRRTVKESYSSSVSDIEKNQQLDPEQNTGTPGHDRHPDKINSMTIASPTQPRKSTSSAVKVHKMYTPPSPKSPRASIHGRQPSTPNIYASPSLGASVPALPPTSTTTDSANATTNTPAIPARRQSRSATVSSGNSVRVTFAQFSDLSSSIPEMLSSHAHIDSVQIDVDSVLPTAISDENLVESGAINPTCHSHTSTILPGGTASTSSTISSKAKRELLQQREQLRRSPSFSMSNIPFPLAPLPPIPVSSNPTSPTLSPTSTPSTSPTPTSSLQLQRNSNSPALVSRTSLRRESRENQKSLTFQFPTPPPPVVPIPALPQEKPPLPPAHLPSTTPTRGRNPAFTHQRQASSRGQELEEIVRQVREEDSKVEALYAAGEVSNHGTTCSRSVRTSLQQSNVNISHAGDHHHQYHKYIGNSNGTNNNAMHRSRLGAPSHHYLPNEQHPPLASPPLPDTKALAAAVEAAAAAAAGASTLANRISTASHRLSKYNNASSPNLKLQASQFHTSGEEPHVSVREQARPRSRSFSSTLIPASLPGAVDAIASPSSSPLPSLSVSLDQHLQAPRPLLQQPQHPFIPSSSSMAPLADGSGGTSASTDSSVSSTPATNPPPSCVGLGISSHSTATHLDQHLPSTFIPSLTRQSSFTQLNSGNVQLPSAHIPAQWRGRFAPDVEKYGGSTPRSSKQRSGTSSRSSTTGSPSPTLLSPIQIDENMVRQVQHGLRRHPSLTIHDELPSQTKERLLRHAAALHTLPEGQSPSERSISRSSSMSSMSDSNASMSTPSRTPAQQRDYGLGRHHNDVRGGHGDSDEDVVGEDGHNEEELRRIIEDAIEIAAAKAAAFRAARESMDGNQHHHQHHYHHHRHAYQLSDAPSPPSSVSGAGSPTPV